MNEKEYCDWVQSLAFRKIDRDIIFDTQLKICKNVIELRRRIPRDFYPDFDYPVIYNTPHFKLQ